LPGGRFTNFLDGWQQQANGHGDDRDDHQQLDERETLLLAMKGCVQTG